MIKKYILKKLTKLKNKDGNKMQKNKAKQGCNGSKVMVQSARPKARPTILNQPWNRVQRQGIDSIKLGQKAQTTTQALKAKVKY